MKRLMLFAFCIVVGIKITSCQVRCEFDNSTLSHQPIYGLDEHSKGYKVLESVSHHFLLLSLAGYSRLPGLDPSNLKSTLTKIDNCGNHLWTVTHDTVVCFSYNCIGIVSMIGMIEEPDESIIYAIYTNNEVSKRGVKLYKIDKNGNLKCKYKIGDTTKYYSLNTLIKINANRVLLAGSIKDAKQTAYVIMTDTLGNTIFQNTFNQNAGSVSNLTHAYKKSANEIILAGSEDSAILIIKIDTLGNTVNMQKITKVSGGFKANTSLVLNYDSSEYLLSNILTSNSAFPLYLARLRLDGSIIKDTMLAYGGWLGNFVKSLPDNSVLFSNFKVLTIIDSNYKVIWKDSSKYKGSNATGQIYAAEPFNDAIISQDKSVLAIGYYTSTSGNNIYYNPVFTKKSLVKYVKSIAISGPNLINVKGGQIQLTAIIMPTDAPNQQINWSINDTSKASIDTSGKVTAKKNGTVMVTATSVDNILATDSKSIAITNQTVGINGMEIQNFVVSIYPNPASNSFSVSLQDNQSDLQFEFLNAQGQQIKNIHFDKINDQLYNIDTKDLEEGMYLLSVQVNESKIYRKVMIVK